MTSVKLWPSELNGQLDAPPSKSMAHRVIIASSLAKGTSIISNIAYSDDIVATIEAMRQCGVQIEQKEDRLVITSTGQLRRPSTAINCNESGSTLRFLIPLLSSFDQPIDLTGKSRLFARPLSVYDVLFHDQGLQFHTNNEGVRLKGPLRPGDFSLKGNVSSQFVTGLLFALPLLKADSTLTIEPPFESQSYVEMTIALLSQFGIKIEKKGLTYFIKGNQSYQPRLMVIEGDFSQAAFFLVGGIIKGNLHVTGLNQKTSQGDQAIVKAIQSVRGDIKSINEGYSVCTSQCHGTTIDLEDTPDLGPVLALLCSLSHGQSRLTHAHRLRLKESDRILSTLTTLIALGAQIKVVNDEFIIDGVSALQGGVRLSSFNDHRIVMMAAIAALRCENPIIIEGAQAINKSYPSFFDDYQRLGGKVEVLTP